MSVQCFFPNDQVKILIPAHNMFNSIQVSVWNSARIWRQGCQGVNPKILFFTIFGKITIEKEFFLTENKIYF